MALARLLRQPKGPQELTTIPRYRNRPGYCQQYSGVRCFSNTRVGKASGHMTSKLALDGKVTVITGGARGIGLALAQSAAGLGSDVALMDVRKPQIDLEKLQQTYGTRIKYYQADVSNMDSLQTAFDKSVTDFGQIDNCVTAAGIALDKPFLDNTWEECRRILEVNVLGSYFSAQLATRQMAQQGRGGSIVMIASIAAHSAVPGQRISIYGASKAGIHLLGKTLAIELAPLKIRVNTLSPGLIDTDMTRQFGNLRDVFRKVPPLGRVGQPDDLTLAVAYLLCDGASYTTGADLAVTGGLHNGRIEL